jgi:hypothetical protein
MAYSDTLELVQGDTRPRVVFTLKDANEAATGYTLDAEDSDTWAPVVLTNASCVFRIRAMGSTTVKNTLSMTIMDGANGTVYTNFPSPALDTAGLFEAEIEVTFGDGSIQTVYDLIKLKVRPQIG